MTTFGIIILMLNIRGIFKGLLVAAALLVAGNTAHAQNTASTARQYATEKNYDKAVDVYQELYGISPDTIYVEYLHTLLDAKKYKQAEKLVEKQITHSPGNNLLKIDMGKVFDAEGKEAKAKEQYEALVNTINGDDMYTQRMVKSFTDAGKDTYAIMAYEKAIQLLGNPFLFVYGGPLAKLYVKQGKLDRAIDVLVANNANQYNNGENTKALLLELIGNDSTKLELSQKILIKKINEHPESVFYAEILTWIYTQRGDWDGALIQIEAVDERNKEDGVRLLTFARMATSAKQYETAVKAFDDVIAKGKEYPNYQPAKSEKLAMALTQIENNADYKPEQVHSLEALYDSFFVEFPSGYTTQAASDYAMLEAVYANNVPNAISILKKAIDYSLTQKHMRGTLKMQLGDYQVLAGAIWEASLTYSQVDKDFVQDALGEDARFRNARLAYYRGDFEWAQRQLGRLKSATSELIANDAIYLSVLITENVEDTVKVPLQRFAYAGLLMFQNKDKETEELLDSLVKAFPEHPLNDDILLMKANLALKHQNYPKALGFLETIYTKYKEDVLGDDAVFKMADIYHNNLHQLDKAQHYYEQLIIDYPGSTYVQAARQLLYQLNNKGNP